MNPFVSWTFGITVAAGLTAGALSVAASATASSPGDPSTKQSAQLAKLEAERARLDAKVSSTKSKLEERPPATTTTGARGAVSVPARYVSGDSTSVSNEPPTTTAPPTTAPPTTTTSTTTAPTTTTTSPSWVDDGGGDGGGSGGGGHDD